MKKLLHIIFPVILSMLFIFMASGVTFRHCACSGKTSMTMGNLSKENSHSSDGCMTISTVSLSPTTQTQTVAFDFQVFQPLVAIINNWDLLCLVPQQTGTIKHILPREAYDPPPRQYLNLISVLII